MTWRIDKSFSRFDLLNGESLGGIALYDSPFYVYVLSGEVLTHFYTGWILVCMETYIWVTFLLEISY